MNYGTECLSPNDDGSSAAIDLTPAFPSGLRFFDQTHTTAYVNTNGNITFAGSLSTFTPNAFPVADQPMIAPYWGDVDIRRLTSGTCQGSIGLTCTVCAPCHNPTENGVWWHLEAGRMIVTWDRVGYYNCNNWRRLRHRHAGRLRRGPHQLRGHGDRVPGGRRARRGELRRAGQRL